MKRLEIELDFHHEPGRVAVRFYRFSDGRRALLRVQDLYNEARRLGRDYLPDKEWSEGDQRFLRDLMPELRAPGLIKQNPQLLKISPEKLELWLERWKLQYDRFLERDTQRPYVRHKPRARLEILLACEGERTRMAARLVGEDGPSEFYHKLRRGLHPAKGTVLIQDRLYELDLPVSVELLDKVFAEGNPLASTEKVLAALPKLLNGRLDLLGGPALERLRQPAVPRLELRSDGANVLLTLRLGRIPILDLAAPAARQLHLRGTRFIVEELTSDLLPELTQRVQALPLRPGPAEGRHLLPGTPENLAALYACCRRLPKGVTLAYDPALAGLFAPGRSEIHLDFRRGSGWVDLHVEMQVGGHSLGELEMESGRHAPAGIVRDRSGRWLRLDDDTRAVLGRLEGLGWTRRASRLNRLEAGQLLDELAQVQSLRLSRNASELAAEIRAVAPLAVAPLPEEWCRQLRPYQVEGAQFLCNRGSYGMGCILADDMGLGKTRQVLACLATLHGRGETGGFLAICPASVLGVWQAEAAALAPGLRVALYVGSPEARRRLLAAPDSWDLLVSSYGLVRNDWRELAAHEFAALVLDEAQQIKNPDAQATRAVKALSARRRIATTGTPLENRLLDLWSICDFLNPGYLGDRDSFLAGWGAPGASLEPLRRRLAPLLLRRRKSEVAPELPPRSEELLRIPMTEEQDACYREALRQLRAGSAGMSNVALFAAITRLRQICCHPRLVREVEGLDLPPADSSAKCDCLQEMLEELLEEGHSALVFSQFTSMLAILEEQLQAAGRPFFKITGATPPAQRAGIVAEFTAHPGPAVFLLSLRAAGTGLTLTKADYVFIYDPWWNPAVENQAIDRAHRIGQGNPVMAYRLVAEDSIEEKVLALQETKRQLFAATIEDAEGLPAQLGRDELLALLGP